MQYREVQGFDVVREIPFHFNLIIGSFARWMKLCKNKFRFVCKSYWPPEYAQKCFFHHSITPLLQYSWDSISELPLGTTQSRVLCVRIFYFDTTGFFYQEYLKSTDIEYTFNPPHEGPPCCACLRRRALWPILLLWNSIEIFPRFDIKDNQPCQPPAIATYQIITTGYGLSPKVVYQILTWAGWLMKRWMDPIRNI